MRAGLTGLFCLAGSAAVAAPSEDWSARIASGGLAGTEAAIAALPQPSDDDLFALGSVRFLRSVERAMQLRWQVGATVPLAPIPLLSISLPPNPAPEPFRASLITEIMHGATDSLEGAEEALAAISTDADVGLVVKLDDLWLDIDGNGARGEQEGLLQTLLDAFGLAPGHFDENTYLWVPEPIPAELLATKVRFDAADVPWMRAYGHLISGVADFALAFDPTEAITRVTGSTAEINARFASDMPSLLQQGVGPEAQGWIDMAAVFVYALRQQPDADLIASTFGHLKQTIALNHDVWRLVALETDNANEWIPGPAQQAALGFPLPPDTGSRWLAVLTELEQMLDGKLLLPYQMVPPDAGINLEKWFEKPSSLDLIGWIQGGDALPYLEKGNVITWQAYWGFNQLFEGRGLLYAIFLN